MVKTLFFKLYLANSVYCQDIYCIFSRSRGSYNSITTENGSQIKSVTVVRKSRKPAEWFRLRKWN